VHCATNVGYVLVSECSIILYYLIYEHFFSFLWMQNVVSQRAFENEVLRGIYGPLKKSGVTECRKIHSSELQNLYTSPGIV
jgi:hypothetical protein